MDEQSQIVERATRYPYDVPSRSFVQVGESSFDLVEFDPQRIGASQLRRENGEILSLERCANELSVALGEQERTAVLAYGSNAAPEVLSRKFRGNGGIPVIPLVIAKLGEFDVVYSAHISAYGSLPATLQHSPGTEVVTFVMYLTDPQMRVMSETEPNYEVVGLDGVTCSLDTGAELTSVITYLSRHGCLSVDGSEAALSSVRAQGRRFPSMSEPQVLEFVRSLLSRDQSLDRFIADNATDHELARERTAVLRADARPFAWTQWSRVGQ